MTKVYTAEHMEFLRNNIEGCYIKDLTKKFNKHFGVNFSISAITGKVYAMGLKNGICLKPGERVPNSEHTKFEKGHTPWNKGKHTGGGPEHTLFKKGHAPSSQRPVGDRQLREDGYLWEKIADPRTWKQVHRINWEKVHGPVPPGHVLIFLDGDRLHCELDNLRLITRRQLAQLNKMQLKEKSKEITLAALMLTDVQLKCIDIKKGERDVG